ncbi:hypothetical protein ACFQ0X_06585 [Streptomyces rectiviolaceus]|uniref:hypothetical protein n=1 Tax=Streptomyces rectiviolaceus TaxID=332591 RepID=UPI0036255FC1
MSGPLPLRPRGRIPGWAENDDASSADDTLALRLARPPRALADDDRPRIRPGVALRPARADDPVDRLAAELAEEAGAAVHAYEVAALLESQGLTGDRIQETYGHPDLFSLADAVFRRVPRSHPKPPVPPDPWRPDHLRCALRGCSSHCPARRTYWRRVRGGQPKGCTVSSPPPWCPGPGPRR